MSAAGTPPDRGVRALVRCYPPEWRRRYGDEFVQLLCDEQADGALSWRRRGDVIAHGWLTRLAARGWTGETLAPARRADVARALGLALLLAGLLGAAALSAQLGVGWRWAAPPGADLTLAVAMVSAAGFGAAVVAAGLLGVLLIAAVRSWRAPGGRVPWLAAGLAVLAAAGLWIGCGRVGAHWPGSGGHAWPGRGLLPAAPARWAWAATLWMSTFWSHPAELGRLGSPVLGWMIIAPVLEAILAVCLARLVSAGRPLLRRGPGRVAAWLLTGMLLLCLAGAVMWLAADRPGPDALFAPGGVDVGITAGVALCLSLAVGLQRRARRLVSAGAAA